jgi:hypothetical protein
MLLLLLICAAGAVGASVPLTAPSALSAPSAPSFPVPTSLPPHSWTSVASKVFIHGCKASGLFNEEELSLAAKFPLLTVEKGQGLDLPGYADDKMTEIAAQWKEKRRDLNLPEGWAMCVRRRYTR